VQKHKDHFSTAVQEIMDGGKKSHWSWYLLPTPPFVDEKGCEIGSDKNRLYALRTDDEVRAFLEFSEDQVDLRKNYLALLETIRVQLLRHGKTLRGLLGMADYYKAISSLELFERIGRSPEHDGDSEPYDEELYVLCVEILEASGVYPCDA
jgi:uncharacterized protein (DUF1810 family)